MSTPRPIYFKHGVIEFYVREKQTYYRIISWANNGLSQYVIESARFDGDADRLLEKAQQNFGDVIRG